jgi:hypothetical protein
VTACRSQQRVDLNFRLVSPDGMPTPTTMPKTWFFDLPSERQRTDVWTELLHRIFYDTNVQLRRREPLDASWLMLDSFTAIPIDVAQMLAWDGTATMESAAEHLPWIVAARKVVWEPAACYIVDDSGRYDGLGGMEFAELVLYRALAAGALGEPEGHALMTKLYPGSVEDLFANREQRFANLIVVRPTEAFRRSPGAPPWESGPPRPADVSA